MPPLLQLPLQRKSETHSTPALRRTGNTFRTVAGWHEGGQTVASLPGWNARGCVICGKMGRQFGIHRRPSTLQRIGHLSFLRPTSSRSSSHHAINQGNTRVPGVGRQWHGWQAAGKLRHESAGNSLKTQTLRFCHAQSALRTHSPKR